MLKCGLSEVCLELVTYWTKQTSWDGRVPVENAAYTVSELKKKKHYWKSTLCQPTCRLFSSLILTATKGRAGPFGEEAKKLNFECNRAMIPNQVFPILRPVLFPVLQLSLLKLWI